MASLAFSVFLVCIFCCCGVLAFSRSERQAAMSRFYSETRDHDYVEPVTQQRSCYQYKHCVQEQCNVPLVYEDRFDVCVPDTSVINTTHVGQIRGVKHEKFFFFENNLELLYQQEDLETFQVFRVTPVCHFARSAFYYALNLSSRAINEHFFKCDKPKKLPFVVTPLDIFRHGLNRATPPLPHLISLLPPLGPLQKVASSVQSQIYFQDCTTSEAVCISKLSTDNSMFRCPADCSTYFIRDFDMAWYERLFATISVLFTLEFYKGLVKSFFKILGALLADVLEFLWDVITDSLPFIWEFYVNVTVSIVRIGLIETFLVFLLVYAVCNAAAALVASLSFLYVRALVNRYFNVS